jgi:tetratricopeptide (TPR) repeat protein
MASAENAYLFRHAMMRAAAYDLLPLTARSELHAHAFAVMEQLLAMPDAARRHDLRVREASWLKRAMARARNDSSFVVALEMAARLVALDVADAETRHAAALQAAEMSGMLGRYEDVPGYLELAESLANTQQLRANGLLSRVGVTCLPQRRFDEALQLLQQALGCYRDNNDPGGEARALGYLGNVYSHLGEREQAIDHYSRAEALFREAGSWRGISTSRGNIGLIHKYFGRHAEAEQAYREAMAIDLDRGHREGVPRHVGNLAVLYRDLGRLDDAVPMFQEADDLFRELGDRPGTMRNLINFADCYKRLGQSHRAVTMFASAERLAEECGLQHTRADCIYYRALTLHEMTDDVRSEAVFLEAVAAYEVLQDHTAIGECYFKLAQAAKRRSDHARLHDLTTRALSGMSAGNRVVGQEGFELLAMHAEAALANDQMQQAAESASAALQLATGLTGLDPIQIATLKAIARKAQASAAR